MQVASWRSLAFLVAAMILPTGMVQAQQMYPTRTAPVGQFKGGPAFILPGAASGATGQGRRTMGGMPVVDSAQPAMWASRPAQGRQGPQAAMNRQAAFQAPPYDINQPSGPAGDYPSGPMQDAAPMPDTGPMPDSGEMPQQNGDGEMIYEEIPPGEAQPFEMYDDYWTGDEYWDDECSDCFSFYTGSHGVWLTNVMASTMQRQSTRNTLLSRDFDPDLLVAIDVMTTKSITFNIAPGMTVNARRFLGSDNADHRYTFEFVYSGLYNWNESTSVGGTRIGSGALSFGSLFSNFASNVGGFSGADLQTAQYQSQLNSFECNIQVSSPAHRNRLVYRAGKGWIPEEPFGFNATMFGGLRLMLIDDDFRFFSQSQVDLNDTVLGIDTGDYTIQTRNRMLGIQLGGIVDQRRTSVVWGIRGNLGGYVNIMESDSTLIIDAPNNPFIDPVTSLNRVTEDSANHVALIGQLGLFGRYKLLNNMSLSAGYDFMWVQGIAAASEQLNFTDADPDETVSPMEINRNGHALFQGASLGCEVLW